MGLFSRKFKSGFAPILVLGLVAVVGFFLAANFGPSNLSKLGRLSLLKKLQGSFAQTSAIPTGTIHASSQSASNSGLISFTSTGVSGAEGAQVDNVRYYLLNPTLAPNNDWGAPDWCSTPCESSSSGQIRTWDISQSSNPGNNYLIDWDKNTHSSGSTPYSRALTPVNLLPGNYTVALRVEDVNGNVNGNASFMTISLGATADSDGDGFDNFVEQYLGTNPNDACGNPVDETKPGKPSLAWPADTFTTGTQSFNKLSLQDLSSFTTPIRRLDTSPGDPNYDKRWDIVPGKSGQAKHINSVDMNFLSTFTAPMFGGQRAFGKTCPFAP